MSTVAVRATSRDFVGNDRVLFGMILGVLAFWLFAQTTLNIAPLTAEELGIGTSVMNIAVSITTLFAGIGGDAGGVQWLDGVVAYLGRQDNVAVREAALVAFGVNLLLAVAAIASVMLTVPKQRVGATPGDAD